MGGKGDYYKNKYSGGGKGGGGRAGEDGIRKGGGKGDYYKNKYVGAGKGGGVGGEYSDGFINNFEREAVVRPSGRYRGEQLTETLRRIDGASYKAYRDIEVSVWFRLIDC